MGREREDQRDSFGRRIEVRELLDGVLEAACELAVCDDGQIFPALERTEAACARLRIWLRQHASQ